MKIFIVSKYGSSQDLAKKLLEEDHDVRMYIRTRSARKISTQPFLVEAPTPDMMNVDLFLIEDDATGLFSSKARELKRPTLGGSILGDRLVRDPVFHARSIEGCGLKVANLETKGIPVNVGGWFSTEFLRPYFVSIRYQRVGAGEVGHETKGMGLTGQYKIKGNFFNILRSLEGMLRSANYQGFVNAQLFVNNDTARVVRLELGLNFPTVAVISSIHGNIGNFLLKLATGAAKQVAVQPDKVGVGVVWLPNIDEATITPTMICNTGETSQEARIKTYKDITKLANDTAYYRIDIGDGYDKYLKQLREWGWM